MWDCGFKSKETGVRRQETGDKRQNEKSKSEYVFSTDYFIIASNLKARRAAPPTSNPLLHALCSMPFPISIGGLGT